MSLAEYDETQSTEQTEGFQPEQQTEQAPQTSEASLSSQPPVEQNDIWHWDEKTPGTDKRPEWLQNRYKTVADQAKAYLDMQKKFGAFKGAPDEYEIKTDIEGFQFREGDPVLQEFLKDAKENNVSQEYVNKMLNTYAKGLQSQRPDLKKELEALGPNGKQEISALNTWASNHLDENEVKEFRGLMTSANNVRLLQKIKSLATRSVTQPSQTVATQNTKEAIINKMKDPRYYTDEVYRKQIKEELTRVM